MFAKRLIRAVVPVDTRQSVRSLIGSILTNLRVPRILRSGTDIKLEIGSGPVRGKNGWVTMDLTPQADLCWDLRNPLPFPDNSIAVIHSSHLLEHLYHPELMKLLRECWRVLKSGGVCSVCVPDARIYIQGYLKPDTFDRSHFTYAPAVASDCRMDIINYIAYMGGHHKHMFDEDNLCHILSSAGFASVRLREFDPTLDLLERRHESIYAYAVKR